MRPLILLGGRLASGKDTVADYLVESRGYVKLGMSDPLNEAMMKLNPWVGTQSDVYGMPGGARRYRDILTQVGYVKAKEMFSEVRRLLQVFGTEVGRELFSDSVWVDIAKRRLKDALATGAPGAILTGVRFPNELDIG